MKRFVDGIPDKVLEEIFPEKLTGHGAPEDLYTHMKKMIRSGELKKGQKLTHEGISQDFDVSKWIALNVISRLEKNRLVIVKRGVGSFVA
jgi:DNA-binding GntR family transcriptional regulator